MDPQEFRQQLRHRTLAAFRLTVETSSATRAAEILGISQPAVSQLLAGLERAVGFALFARGAGRRLEPTPEARRLFEEVCRVLDAMTTLERRAGAISAARPDVHEEASSDRITWRRSLAE